MQPDGNFVTYAKPAAFMENTACVGYKIPSDHGVGNYETQ